MRASSSPRERSTDSPDTTAARLDAERRTYLILGECIARERKRLGLTVRGLADRSGVGSGFIGDIENGRGNPTWQTLCRLSEALGRNLVGLLAECHEQFLREVSPHLSECPVQEEKEGKKQHCGGPE